MTIDKFLYYIISGMIIYDILKCCLVWGIEKWWPVKRGKEIQKITLKFTVDSEEAEAKLKSIKRALDNLEPLKFSQLKEDK